MTRPRCAPARLLAPTPTDRARVIARATFEALAEVAPEKAAEIERMARVFGEDVWLTATVDTAQPGALLTRDQVAARAGVDPDTVSAWTSRGIRRNGGTVRLTRLPGGYDPAETARFLQLRDGGT